MRAFSELLAIATARKGGMEAVEARLIAPLSTDTLAATPLSDWLSCLSRAVFQAGFNWRVVDAKWPGFIDAFDGFDIHRIAGYHPEQLDRLISDNRVIRNGAKLASVQENARLLAELDHESGNASALLANWPGEDFSGLLAMFAKRGSRLGGTTAQRACRMMGKDSYILTSDVVARLVIEGVIDKPPTSARSLVAVQVAFNVWREQSGRPLTQISQILAMSVG